MANDSIQLYNFYRRYKWRAIDFEDFQKGIVEQGRGPFEGTFGAAVLKGFGAVPIGGLEVLVQPGIGVGATGYLNVVNSTSQIAIPAASGSIRRDLIVVRPALENNLIITSPTSPFATVPLRTAQKSQVLLVTGTEAESPEYPATEPNDVVVCGVRNILGQTDLTVDDIDLEVRDIPGKNSNFQQDQGKYDDRLRPSITSATVVSIKPSQLEPPFARVFSYVNRQRPSIFPKNGSNEYNGSFGDTDLDFETGSITGADLASPAFSPTIPTAQNAVVACVSLTTNDTLVVSYGDEGTLEECFSGIRDQRLAGAGSVVIGANTKPICFVIVYSEDGLSPTELFLFDCRSSAAVGAVGGVYAGSTVSVGAVDFPYSITSASDGIVHLVNTTAGPGQFQLPSPQANLKFIVKDVGGAFATNPLTLLRDASESLEGLAADYVMESNYGTWTWICDGTDWVLI